MSEVDYDKLMERLAGELQEFSPSTLEENIRRGADVKSQMKELKESPAFKLFLSGLEKQLAGRIEEMCKSRPGLDGAITNVHSIGEIAGIKLALAFADTMIEHADEAIRMNEQMLSLHIPDEEKEQK